ncbi:hypothetical protein GCM10009118_18360 [Wandonia haliotis]|uniref:PAS domain S-box protein n=1 Tax=Wandonia haliotis TaxID=574963 RepID=A0ABN1MRB8_9FLAO
MTNQLVLASQFLLLSLAVFHPVAGLLYEYFSDVNDPFLIRLLFSVYCLLALLLIIVSRKVRRHHWRISRITFALLSLQTFYLTWINEINPAYFATIPIIVVSAPIFFTRYRLLVPFLSFIVLLTIVSGSYYGINEDTIFFFLLVGLSLPVSFFNLFLFRRIIKKLQFSDYVLNNIDALVLASDASGEVTFVSKNVNRILGYSRQEILNRGWWDVRMQRKVTDEELTHFRDHINERADREDGYDSMVVTKEGSEKWFHWKVVSLGKKSKVGVGQEITRKKNAENELKKLSLIARETDNIVLLLGEGNTIEWVNPGFLKVTLYDETDVLGADTSSFFFEQSDSPEIFHSTIHAVYEDRCMHYAELRLKKKSGEEFWANISFTPILEEGRVARIICIGRDSTKTKEAEAQIRLYSERLRTLHKLDQKLLKADSLNDIFNEIIINVKGFGLPCNRVSIAIYEFDEEFVNVISGDPQGSVAEIIMDKLPIGDFKRSIHILKSAEFIVNDLDNANESELTPSQKYLYKDHGVGGYISLPIRYNKELVGSLNFGSTSAVDFDAETIDFLKEITSDVALAVYQFRLKEAIRVKNAKLEQRNKDITDSINYARRIQNTFLPSPQDLEEYFDDSLVLFKPKDKLSGDFYWVEETPDAVWVVVADCTGHGIPGALVSLVGTNILNQAIYEKKMQTPDEVLAYLNLKVIRTFSSQNKENGVNDAMDIGICCIRKNEGILLYAGVLNDLYLVRNGELQSFKSSRYPIGLKPERVFMDFEMHHISVQPDDQFYMLSDGFTDQFGGEQNKKFGKRSLKRLILEIQDYPMPEQLRILQNTFDLWKKDHEQTDDVVLLGFKIKQIKK